MRTLFCEATNRYTLKFIKSEKAIEHHEKFLDLWKDADPCIPGGEDAKVRLAGLQTQ